MIEVWKDIEDYIHLYQISNFGRVRSLTKKVQYSDRRLRNYPEKILKPRINGKGYYFVTLYDSDKYQISIHRLVAKAFIDNPFGKFCVNHKDSNRLNNVVDNLEWVTYKENTEHAILKGNIFKPGKKITQFEVNDIRKVYKNSGLIQKEIAKRWNLSQSQISKIITKKNWI